jgi:hypothetical protein
LVLHQSSGWGGFPMISESLLNFPSVLSLIFYHTKVGLPLFGNPTIIQILLGWLSPAQPTA